MLRYLLYGILSYVGYRLIMHFLFGQKPEKKRDASGMKSGDDVLVSCAVCRTRVPRQLMVQRPHGLFCSLACADS